MRLSSAPQPTVCCVLLANERSELVNRAVTSFRAQTYERKRLLIWDTTRTWGPEWARIDDERVSVSHPTGATIGRLRNEANAYAMSDTFTPGGARVDLIAHWDLNDWSHPRRLEEQVALMEATGKQCVGYRELLFWDTRVIGFPVREFAYAGESTLPVEVTHPMSGMGPRNEAWIYRGDQRNWAAGASFLYRRELWEKQPFEDGQRWWRTPLVNGNCVGALGIECRDKSRPELCGRFVDCCDEPRMICGINDTNADAYDRAQMMRNPDVWRRAPQFDSYCERIML